MPFAEEVGTSLPRQGHLSVGVSSEFHCEDEHGPLAFVHHTEEAEIPNAISPSVRRVAPQLPDVGAEERFTAKLRIDAILELPPDPGGI